LIFTYIRGPRTETEPVPTGKKANFMFFLSVFTVGQCSSFTNETYFNDLASFEPMKCFECESSGTYAPSAFRDQCQFCNSLSSSDEGICDSVAYCTMCNAHDACEESDVSTCKEDVGCSGKSSESACVASGDCAWCPIDEECVYKDDTFNCTLCGDLSKEQCLEHSSICGWCPVTMKCIDTGINCPLCSSIGSKNKCTLDKTDKECQWCNHESACQKTTDVCDSSCSYSSSSNCSAGTDCQWCISSDQCQENRIFCDICTDLPEAQCSDSTTYPGCKYCEFTECQTADTECITCEEMNETECGWYPKCTYCASAKMCMPTTGFECPECSDLSQSQDECASYAGCSFCKSDMECLRSNETCQECRGLDQTVCRRHSKGCCYSKNDNECYFAGDSHCDDSFPILYIILIVVGGVIVIAAAILIPVLVCCCKKKTDEDVEMHTPGTIVVLPEGQPSMVVASESMQSIGLEPAGEVSVDGGDASGVAPAASAQVASSVSMSDMQNMMVQQQLLNTMMAQQQMSMMMNPMMANSMMNMAGMAGMSGMGMGGMPMNSMGMDMNSMNMTGGMNSMNMTSMGQGDSTAGDQAQ